MQTFACGTKIIAGPGARWSLKDQGAKRVFLVTDSFFSEKGTALEIAQALGETYEIFDQVIPDPTAELVARGTARLKAFHPDLVVALGGGSPMDTAKAMVYFSGEQIPLAAIPTTSGSGAEVTDFAIVTHDEVKHPLVSERLRPQWAILDSELLAELPRSLIADAGFDVLAHALEAVAGRNASPITDALARDAFRTAYSLLPASYGGDPSVRLAIHQAATMAAMAFSQAGLGICHALAHSLGGPVSRPPWAAQCDFAAHRGVLQRGGSRGGLYGLSQAGRAGRFCRGHRPAELEKRIGTPAPGAAPAGYPGGSRRRSPGPPAESGDHCRGGSGRPLRQNQPGGAHPWASGGDFEGGCRPWVRPCTLWVLMWELPPHS